MISRSAELFHVVVLLTLCGLLFFPSLPRIPFFNKGEPREALVVQEIFHHGNWLFPLKRGEEIPSKPPLFHWFGALASLAWGEATETTVRFPSALFATLGVLVIYVLGRYLFNPRTAFWAGVILATSVGYQGEAISARVDMTLSFFVTLSLALFYLLYREVVRGELWRYAWYLLLGISVLAKGPVGLVLPGMIIFGFVALRRRWDFLSELCFHKGLFLTLAIPLLWYGLALSRGGEDFVARQIVHENLARFFVYGEGGSGHQKPFYYYVPYLMLDGLPWSLFLPFVIYEGFRRKPFSQERLLLLSLWAGIIFVFFSLSAGKRSAYLLPLYPPLSLLIASWLAGGAQERVRALGLKTVGLISLIMGLALLLVVWAIVEPARLQWAFAELGGVLKPKDQAQLAIVQQVLSQAGSLLLFSVLLSAGLWCVAAAQLFAADARGAVVSLAALSVIAGLLVQGVFLPSVAESRSYKPFVLEVNRRMGKGGSLRLCGQGWDPTSVIFYRGADVPVLDGGLGALRQYLRSADAYCIMSEREWKHLVASGKFSYPVVLTSRGGGPDGDDPLVLIGSGV